MGFRHARPRQAVERLLERKGVGDDVQPGHSPPGEVNDVQAGIGGSNAIRAGIGLVPVGQRNRVPWRSAYLDARDLESDVRQQPKQPLIPFPRRGQTRPSSAERVLPDEYVLVIRRKRRHDGLGIARADRREQFSQAILHDQVIRPPEHRFASIGLTAAL